MLDGWHEFYILLGTAAAALVALLFVAVSIGAGFLSRESAGATRTFMSPVIFHYASVLFLSLIALIPTHTAISLAAAIGVVAAVGLLYSVMILIRVLRDPVGDTADALAYGAHSRRRGCCWRTPTPARTCSPPPCWSFSSSISATPGIWRWRLPAGRPSTIGSRALIPDRHLDLGAGLTLAGGSALHQSISRPMS